MRRHPRDRTELGMGRTAPVHERQRAGTRYTGRERAFFIFHNQIFALACQRAMTTTGFLRTYIQPTGQLMSDLDFCSPLIFLSSNYPACIQVD